MDVQALNLQLCIRAQLDISRATTLSKLFRGVFVSGILAVVQIQIPRVNQHLGRTAKVSSQALWRVGLTATFYLMSLMAHIKEYPRFLT